MKIVKIIGLIAIFVSSLMANSVELVSNSKIDRNKSDCVVYKNGTVCNGVIKFKDFTIILTLGDQLKK